MKKYKLIKEYPGSPKLGHIIEVSPSSPSAQFIEGYWVYKIESSPEFWQEITKPEYTILSFKQNTKLEDLWINPPNSSNMWYRSGGCTVPYTTEEILENSLYSIYSVRRESDDEVFTVGDNIGQGIILNFKIQNNRLLISTSKVKNYWFGFIFDNIQKNKKQPLFTTEDGVDIYEGDTYYIINPKLNYLLTNHIAENGDNFYKTFIKFSTKEKAEEYILENKPCLSLNDIFNTVTWLDNSKKLLKELVKQKLKQ